MPWSSLIRALGGKRHLREPSAERKQRMALDVPARASRTTMGLDVSPVHGRHCICNRCAMLTDQTRDAA